MANNIRPNKFMQSERGGHARYGRQNNYSPHGSNLSRDHEKRGGFNKFQKYDDYSNSYNNYQTNHNTYHDNQLGDSLFHKVEDNSVPAPHHTQHSQQKFQNTQMRDNQKPKKQSGNEYVLPDRKDEETNARYKHRQ